MLAWPTTSIAPPLWTLPSISSAWAPVPPKSIT
jgi:hypothetical protein